MNKSFEFWRKHHSAPYHFPMDANIWGASVYADVDSDGRRLFAALNTEDNGYAMVQYGYSAFGFDENGNISSDIHYPIIRDLTFAPEHPDAGKTLLKKVLGYFQGESRIYAFFHYFGMSACARHGKLHESQRHIHELLLQNSFVVEHENVYYSRWLTEADVPNDRVQIIWKDRNAGDCREFAAMTEGEEIGWGQVHFLPQGDIAYLRWIYIDEKRQHQGLGTATMENLFAELRQMGIRRFDTDTARNNTAAQGYYEKTGFTNEGITRSYYTK